MPDPNVRQTGTPRGPMSSPVRDLKNVRRNVAATAGEVREFMGRLRGKSPREMLGVVASSSLVQSTITAALVTAILIVVLTVGPYTYGKIFGPTDVVAEKTTDEPEESGTGDPASNPYEEPAPETPATTPEAPGEGTGNPPADPLDVLGVGEEKPAPPGTNPLEGATDNLFDDVK